MPLSRRSFAASAVSMVAMAATTRVGDALDTVVSTGAVTADDPLGVRADFPVVGERRYLNSAYITPIPRSVVAAGQAFVESKSLRPIALGDMLRKTDEVRAQFARLVNASTDEIGFLFSTSEGENVVAQALDLGRGDNVVIDELHYETEFVLYRHLEAARGIELRIVKHRGGSVDAGDFSALVDRRTRLVSVAWVSHQNGFRHDMRPIADLAHAKGALFYTDAIQAVGMFPVDVRQAGVDFLCCGTYKWLLGGYRIRLDRFGALHVEQEGPNYSFELYKSAKRFDYSTLPFAEIYQLGAALSFLDRVGVDRIERHTVALATQLRRGLADQGWRLFTPEGNGSSIVTFYFGHDAAPLKAALDAAKVDVTIRDSVRQVRVSPALFNTSEDVARFLQATNGLR